MMESCEEAASALHRPELDEKSLQAQLSVDNNFEFGAEISNTTNAMIDNDVDYLVGGDDDDDVDDNDVDGGDDYEVENEKDEFASKTKLTKIIETATTTSSSTTAIESITTAKITANTSGNHSSSENASETIEEQQNVAVRNHKNPARNAAEEEDVDDESYMSEDSSSSDSDFSDLSGLSDVSGREWKPINTRPINWVQKQIHSGVNPRDLLQQMLPSSVQHQIAPELNDMTLWRILVSMLSEPPRRQKLRYVNTFEDVIDLIKESKNIMILTGAGVSVSCGIPDFRSSDGIYSRLAKDYPDLPDPQAMFDINYFSRDPRPFFKFAREIYPGQFKPSPCHRFIKLLEQKQKLLRNYTQNIDTLEQVAGISNVIECHGSFSTASCTKCKFKCNADAIRPDIFAQRIPVCPRCQPNKQQSVDASQPVSELALKELVENGIMKPDIVFFGEGLPDEFHNVMASDKDKCDLLIVIGSSLKVRPVALIPSSIPANVPQILINREQLHHLEFDVELLGDSDVIINELCHRLGDDWKDICFSEQMLNESKFLLPRCSESDEGTDSQTEDEQQQLLLHDAETQSLKSNASTDIAQSAGACSESGFESSTSVSRADKEAISPTLNNLDLKPPNSCSPHSAATSGLALDESMDAAVDGTSIITPLSGSTVAASPSTAMRHLQNGDREQQFRHLSIDSSKDSGIQSESSNSSALPNSSAIDMPASSSATATTTDASELSKAINRNKALVSETEDCPSALRPMPTHQRLSAAERLQTGTFYYHESTYSYVFPGAQVSWSSSEDEFDDELDEENLCNSNNAIDAVEEEQPCSSASVSHKRHSSSLEPEQDDLSTEQCCSLSSSQQCDKPLLSNKSAITSSTEQSNQMCSPPPIKKRRDSGQQTLNDSTNTLTNASAKPLQHLPASDDKAANHLPTSSTTAAASNCVTANSDQQSPPLS